LDNLKRKVRVVVEDDAFYKPVTNKDNLTIDDDIYKSIIGEYHEIPSVVPEFRKIPRNFMLKYSSPYQDLDMEMTILSRQKEMLYLRIMFIGMILFLYVIIF